MKEIIFKYVLKNAYEFAGKVHSKVVLGLVLREKPNLKKKVPEVLAEIEKVILEVKEFNKNKIKQELQKIAPELLEKKKEVVKGPLKPLPKAEEGKVMVRIAPSPTGPLHVGHAYGASINYEYAKFYKGKFILRIEDTNPEKIFPPAYEMIEEDARWLSDNHLSEVFIQSSRLGKYYDYAEKLVQAGKAYVCTCDADQWRELKAKGKTCSCRSLEIKEQHERYAKMFSEYAAGEAVLRIKTDIKHKNPAMRDFSLMRINDHIHPKTNKEQRVWPLMVFSVAIDDHELGITHVLNGKDQTDNSKKEEIIMNYLGWKPPVYKHWGSINFSDMQISKSKTKLAIEQGEYSGWDDIRLPYLAALKKRGYQAGAFRKYALEIGLSLNDKTVSKEEFWKNINAFNKEIVEKMAIRYYFVEEPVKIKILKAPKKEVAMNLHPDFPKRGKRIFSTNQEFYIAKKDFSNLKEGKLHRLMDCFNFRKEKENFVYESKSYENFKNAKNRGTIIHWLPVNKNLVKVKVMLENGEDTEGLGEEALSKLKVGDIVQLERQFFARLNEIKKGELTFWYLHK